MPQPKNESSLSDTRRSFLRRLGVSTAALPFLTGLPLYASDDKEIQPQKRLIVMFSPNGTLPTEFWPEQFGPNTPLQLKPMLKSLEPFQDQILMLKGVHNKIRGDGDGHMRGMSCLLTGTELNPGNIQGGGHTPAGWGGGISIDQEVRRFFQSQPNSKTRFGSLEFGVAVPNRADPWTRMCYSGSDRPIAPVDDPGQMLKKLYGGSQDRKTVASVLDHVREDLNRVSSRLGVADRRILEDHLQAVRQLELDIAATAKDTKLMHPEPEVDPNIELVNDNTPAISRMQIELLVSGLANGLTNVASLQFMRSVGQARMRWLDIQEGHHSLSHEPDSNADAQAKLQRINAWFAGELAYLAKRLCETPVPERPDQNMLDHTQIVWINELGKGNSHTLNNIPFFLLGGGAGFKTGRALDLKDEPHNRLWLSLAHGLGHDRMKTFGSEKFCADGPLDLS